MKIQIVEIIKQGIDLSFKDKTVLGLIVLYSVLGIVFSILTRLLVTEPKGFDEMAYPPALPTFGTNENLTIFALSVVSVVILFAIVKASFESLNKREISVSDAVVSALKKFIPIFIAIIIYSIIVVLGSIALIIPGIFLSVALSFYGHVILLKNKGIIASFKESYNIVKGNWWQVFALSLVLIMFSFLAGILFGLLSLVLPLYLTDIILMVVTFFMTGVMMVIFTIVYVQLIKEEEKTKKQSVVGFEIK